LLVVFNASHAVLEWRNEANAENNLKPCSAFPGTGAIALKLEGHCSQRPEAKRSCELASQGAATRPDRLRIAQSKK